MRLLIDFQALQSDAQRAQRWQPLLHALSVLPASGHALASLSSAHLERLSVADTIAHQVWHPPQPLDGNSALRRCAELIYAASVAQWRADILLLSGVFIPAATPALVSLLRRSAAPLTVVMLDAHDIAAAETAAGWVAYDHLRRADAVVVAEADCARYALEVLGLTPDRICDLSADPDPVAAAQTLWAWLQRQPLPCPAPAVRPRLAYISPLPPQHTGIADYSAELLPELARHYAIELIVDQATVSDPWLNTLLPIRDAAWLRRHAADYARVVYQVGNSQFHAYQFELLADVPGVVVLHDFFLSGACEYLQASGQSPYAWQAALYHAHGYQALHQHAQDPKAAALHYPVNLAVLQHARGLIVHSHYAVHLLRQWYGDTPQQVQAVIPHLRRLPPPPDRHVARHALGLSPTTLLVCAFGLLGPSKLNHRLLSAWQHSHIGQQPDSRLVFVGELPANEYGCSLQLQIQASGLARRIHITGWADTACFRRYLAAADIAVQLRSDSRGETSGTVLDAMSHGLAVLVNANGSMAELPEQAVWRLEDAFTDEQLSAALDALSADPQRRQALGTQAVQAIAHHHDPAHCAARYATAIESSYRDAAAQVPALLPILAAELGSTASAQEQESVNLAHFLALSLPPCPARPRVYLDVSATCHTDRRTGIERVVRALIMALVQAPPSGYRCEPVYLAEQQGQWQYRYARRYTSALWAVPEWGAVDEPVEPYPGDVLLTLDLSGSRLIQASAAGLFAEWRRREVATAAVVYDLLPIQLPWVFPPGADQHHERWLQCVSQFDQALCISQAVAADLRRWAAAQPQTPQGLAITAFALGADVEHSAPTQGLPEWLAAQAAQWRHAPTLLMVGTIEPRKGYQQVLQACDRLWAQGRVFNLVIVGSEGWVGLPDAQRRDIPEVVRCLREHPYSGQRLFWLAGLSDEGLTYVYCHSSALLAASWGEGFGLPLIEAARHGLPLIVRDLPVFREVAGSQAYYFTAAEATELAAVLDDWLAQYAVGQHPRPPEHSLLTWQHSAADLVAKLPIK